MKPSLLYAAWALLLDVQELGSLQLLRKTESRAVHRDAEAPSP